MSCLCEQQSMGTLNCFHVPALSVPLPYETACYVLRKYQSCLDKRHRVRAFNNAHSPLCYQNYGVQQNSTSKGG